MSETPPRDPSSSDHTDLGLSYDETVFADEYPAFFVPLIVLSLFVNVPGVIYFVGPVFGGLFALIEIVFVGVAVLFVRRIRYIVTNERIMVTSPLGSRHEMPINEVENVEVSWMLMGYGGVVVKKKENKDTSWGQQNDIRMVGIKNSEKVAEKVKRAAELDNASRNPDF